MPIIVYFFHIFLLDKCSTHTHTLNTITLAHTWNQTDRLISRIILLQYSRLPWHLKIKTTPNDSITLFPIRKQHNKPQRSIVDKLLSVYVPGE